MKPDLLADVSFSRHYSAGEVVIWENDTVLEMFYILNGKAGIYKEYQKKNELQIATIEAHEFFGEMALFLNQGRSATVVALEDLEVLVINKENSFSLFQQRPGIAVEIITSLCRRLTVLNSTYSRLHGEFKLDSFTKIYNRATFDSVLLHFVEQFHADFSKTFSLLIFDVDKFKRINDTYGHAFGDQVILALVSVIQNGIRSSDYAFRYGGEEFTVILPEGEQMAFTIAERIRLEFEKKTYIDHPECRFTVSAGICECYKNATPLELFQKADEALLLAKNTGRNRVILAHGR